jgi:tripartite-type tricarboxylate transporter receptor subunit TctC
MTEKLTPRRDFLVSTLTSSLLSLGLLGDSSAQKLELRKIICPFSSGGIADKLSRVISLEASRLSNDSWYVQNIPGAGGLIGSIEAAISEPNGKTILFSPTGVFRTKGGKEDNGSRVDPIRDLEPSIIFGVMPLLCVTSASKDRSNFRTYLNKLRSSNTPFVYATAGHGSTSHFMGEYIAKRFQLESIHVPFAGSAPTVTAVLGGHVPCAIVDPMPVFGHIKNGDLHCMAISSFSRDVRLPHAETIVEQELSSFEFTSWQGLLIASSVSPYIKTQLGQLFRTLSKSEKLITVLHECFIKPNTMSGQAAQTFFKNDHRLYQSLMAELDIVIN